MSAQPQEQVQTEISKPQTTVLVGKSGKKICCACPATKKERDECVVTNGPEACSAKIEAHKMCLREDGFQVD
jgi:cytochrome c oxidase assembly protein subunit 17